MSAQNLAELRQMCCAPYDSYSCAAWCEAANDAVGIAVTLAAALDDAREDVARCAADTTAVELRQEIEFIKAEHAQTIARLTSCHCLTDETVAGCPVHGAET